MGAHLRKLTISALLAGLAAVLVAPPAEANRGVPTTTTTSGYVPPPQYGGITEVHEEDPYGAAPTAEPTVVPVDFPAQTDPGLGQAGGGEPLGPAPVTNDVLAGTDTRPEVEAPKNDGFFGGVLSRTGAETLPLARAGIAAIALGIGLVALARRRRIDGASA
jgi:hypothetical protein